jgi:hypothetical protein
MEIVDPSGVPEQHKWLRWAGLEEPPAEADSWVPIVRGLAVSDAATHMYLGARLVDLLSEAGIRAQQRSYEFNDVSVGTEHVTGLAGFSGRVVTRVAVLVHSRDRERAIQVAVKLEHEIERDEHVSDKELTRLALDAGPPPDDVS